MTRSVAIGVALRVADDASQRAVARKTPEMHENPENVRPGWAA
jgi:hypothetical protein